ncbi:MAG: hypothetical protein IKO76_06895 [Butyrivibrio sp.]|nr:hypothetical protein [Butyrivibrio sp.]
MDNFMNKLVGKISAQDIIKANSQAEAAEAQRIKLEAENYKIQLDEIRQNNEEYKKQLEDIRFQSEQMRQEAEEFRAQFQEMLDATNEYKEKLEDNDVKIHDVGVQVYRNVQAVVEKSQNTNRESFKEVSQKLESIQVLTETKNSALLPISIITMLLVIADITITVLHILGYI